MRPRPRTVQRLMTPRSNHSDLHTIGVECNNSLIRGRAMARPEHSPLPMMIMHDFEYREDGTAAAEWPPHITVVPFFTAPESAQPEVLYTIGQIASDTQPFPIRAGKTVMHVPYQEEPATKMDDFTDKLHRLHKDLMHGLGRIGCRFADVTYAFENYLPHVSHVDGFQLPTRMFAIDAISLVQKYPKGTPDNKRIMRLFALGTE